MKVLYYDCFAGISGDMNLGALLDLGVEEAYLQGELAKLDVGRYALQVSHAQRNGILGTQVQVVLAAPEGHYRTLPTIVELIERSDLSAAVKQLSQRVFSRLAKAEAKVHGIGIDEVHFHEVGAVDAIVDIVGAAIALERLAVDRVMSSSLSLGAGFAECSHGKLPVPAPATLELLRGVPTRWGQVPFEATTPTGAALLASVVDEFTDTPTLSVEKVGYGVGQRKALEIPNLLRVVLGDQRLASDLDESLVLLECNIDDMNPELYDYVLERLFNAGAHDAWLTPLIMKKGRPGILLSVLCADSLVESLTGLLLIETTTLGVRRQRVIRTALQREMREVDTPYGPVLVKVAYRHGQLLKVKPEYEVCKRIAKAQGIPVKSVYDEVHRGIHGAFSG